MRIFCCQLDIVWEDRQANYEKVRRLLKAASIPPRSMVVLPEMFSTGFSMNLLRTVEAETSESEQFLAELAREYGVYVVGGVVRRATHEKGANEAVVFSPDGSEAARYRKMQPFSLGGEGEAYEAGNAPVTFAWENAVVAPFVCYDLRFPELFRSAVRLGAQIYIVIANWPEMRIAHWVTLLQARAIENLAYVVGVNRIGSAPNLEYTGRSLVVDPHGNIVADAEGAEQVISAELNLDALLEWRKAFPALRDMRADRQAIG